jgi:hypothetical protein
MNGVLSAGVGVVGGEIWHLEHSAALPAPGAWWLNG